MTVLTHDQAFKAAAPTLKNRMIDYQRICDLIAEQAKGDERLGGITEIQLAMRDGRVEAWLAYQHEVHMAARFHDVVYVMQGAQYLVNLDVPYVLGEHEQLNIVCLDVPMFRRNTHAEARFTVETILFDQQDDAVERKAFMWNAAMNRWSEIMYERW